MREFIPCEPCASKPGSPTLCESCLSNRAAIDQRDGIINRLQHGLRILKETLELMV